MPESQNIEWKQSWKEDYLKWVCGFANAQGGKIYVGVDDQGQVFPLSNSRQLLEEIPNKIRTLLGLNIDVNLRNDGHGDYIEIAVPRQPNAISFRGRYYYRSGSVKSELSGSALNEFLLKKAGTSWDATIEAGATLEDIDLPSLELFIEDARKTDRLPVKADIEPTDLLNKLRLAQHDQLTRAALVLFGSDPLRFFPGASIKIGRFGSSHSDLLFQDVVEGGLIRSLRSTIDLLDRKYLPRPIRFEGLQRYEDQIYPGKALREVLLNAMVHRRYQSSAHIQIRISERQLSVWNDGPLPEELPLSALHEPHASRPRNPLIADVCFKAGYIDTWGRGIEVIKESCAEAQLPPATFQEENGGVLVTLTSTLSEGANTGNEGANRSSEGATSGNKGAPDPEMMAHQLRFHYAELDQEPRSDSIAAPANILSTLPDSPGQQAAEIAEATQVAKSTVERHLAVLKKDGFVEIQGSGKSRAYHPTEKARKLREQDATL